MARRRRLFWKIFWPGFTAVMIGGIISIIVFTIVFIGVIGSIFDFEEPKLDVKNNTVLHLKLNGTITERSTNELSQLNLSLNQTDGLSDLLFGINKARSDSRIKGIFIELSNVDCGISTANEIRDAIRDFKKSGKFVIAYLSGEYVSQKSYYISSAASKIYGFPNSAFQWTGLGGEVIFFKDLLDDLDIDIEIIRGKDNHFKSAVEPFSLNKMSDSSRAQTKKYLDVIWNEMCQTISKERQISIVKLNQIADSLLIRRMDDAKKFNLTDDLLYKDEVLKIIAKKLGKTNSEDIRFLSLEKYSRRFFYNQQEGLQELKPKIAVLIAEGEISKSGSEMSSNKICKLLREIKNENSIKSLIIRINSPGGSALASEEIWREITRIKKEKEVIVSMGDVAASGGYYIATPADRIFAESTTITGSIGVFGLIPYLGDFLQNKIGLTFDQVSTNKHSVISLGRKITREELLITKEEVNDIYMQFLKRVSDGRDMPIDSVKRIARGRVWAGEDALKLGLIDEIGGLADAIQYVSKKHNYSKEQVIFYPLVKESIIDKFKNYLDDNKDDLALDNEEKIENKIYKNFNSYIESIYKLESMSGIQMRLPFQLKIN